MARQKAISVKIATPKVIKALEQSLNKLELDWTSQEANEAKYNKSYESWKKQLVEFAVTKIVKAENLRANYRSWNKTLNVDFDLTVAEGDFPTEPQRDFTTINDYAYREMVEEINNALSILRMTDEETVNASTMKQIAKYL